MILWGKAVTKKKIGSGWGFLLLKEEVPSLQALPWGWWLCCPCCFCHQGLYSLLEALPVSTSGCRKHNLGPDLLSLSARPCLRGDQGSGCHTVSKLSFTSPLSPGGT